MNLGKKRFVYGEPLNPEDGLSKNTERVNQILVCTYAIDHENTYPVVSIILVIMFLIVILLNYYYISYL